MEKEHKVETGERWNFIYRLAEAIARELNVYCNYQECSVTPDEFAIIRKTCSAVNKVSCEPPLPTSEVYLAVGQGVAAVLKNRTDKTEI